LNIQTMSIVKYLAKNSDWNLSNLQIQKVLYISNMIWLGENGTPLIDAEFEAWDYGPVVAEVYHKLKCFGSRPVGNIFRRIPDIKDDRVAAFLNDAIDHLGHKSGAELVAISHWEKGAWAKNYHPGKRNVLIPREDILEEYSKRFPDG